MADPSRLTSADRRLAALFPDETVAVAGPWWRRRSGVAVILGVVVALIVGGVVAASAFGSPGDNYRTASAATENVDAMLTGVATIEPVAQASVAFPVSGTVASVNVQIGQAVGAGGSLASLDTRALERTLHTKQAALAQAQLTLSKALSGQSVGGVGVGGTGSTGGTNGAAAATTAADVSGASSRRIVLTAATVNPHLAAAQQAVIAAQQQVDAALAAAATALDAESSVCAAFTTPPPTTTTTPPPTAPDVTACQQAITAVTDAQHAVDTAQQALAVAANALDALLAQLAVTPPPTTTPPATAPPARSGSTGAGGTSGASSSSGSGSSRSGTSGGSGSSSPSAADLIAYQQPVDSAAAGVAVAQQSLDQATIASPLAGTVVAVNLTVGESVSANSSTANVVVQGTGGYEITTTVSVDSIPSVSVGQAATVVPDGTHDRLTGKVVAISVTPTSTSTSSPLYRVTIGLTDPNAKLNNGATGTVSIVTKQARSALAVPTSAVTTTRNRHFVSVLNGGSVTAVAVQVGVVGSTWTEITNGLHPGQQVVLADGSASLPSSATASTSSTSGTNQFGGPGDFGRPGGLGGGGGGGGAGRAGNRAG
jgi:multidrug efflux pump subunit AcrA (membrane-fusion protein)